MTEPLLLKGLDGCNPLALMALLGVSSICARVLPRVRIGWMAAAGGWRPALHGYGGSANDFAQALVDAINAAPPSPFDIDNRLPFSRDKLRQAMRWDPVEDQRYALRWGDPSQASGKKRGLLGMKGANALAIEGLAMLPVQPQARGVDTTAIAKLGKLGECFTWPIWDAPLGADVLRSLLATPELRHQAPDRRQLRALGIVEVYRCERIASSKYYKNFSPARPA